MSDLMLDVDQASELKAAFRRGNWTNAEIKRASEGDFLAKVRDALRGFSAIIPIPHAIDCTAAPFVPSGWGVHEQDQLPGRIQDIFTWDPAKVKLFRSKKQRGSSYIEGAKLRDELAAKPVLPAHILDYLLEHLHLIPEDWKGAYIFFWGTVYRSSGGSRYVRYLCWCGGRWVWDDRWLGNAFDSGNLAALAS